MHVSISKGNGKMGGIPSVSLPAWTTCRPCDCHSECYAKRLERIRPSVEVAYKTNLRILREDPETYWREVEEAIMLSRFFRFHVSGDIPDAKYLCRMTEVAERNGHCQILCFTKKYELVNTMLSCGIRLPPNLHMIFSGWRGLSMNNPYRLPEAHVRYRDGSTTADQNAKECPGKCAWCAITSGGCWSLTAGEQIVFNKH